MTALTEYRNLAESADYDLSFQGEVPEVPEEMDAELTEKVADQIKNTSNFSSGIENLQIN